MLTLSQVLRKQAQQALTTTCGVLLKNWHHWHYIAMKWTTTQNIKSQIKSWKQIKMGYAPKDMVLALENQLFLK